VIVKPKRYVFQKQPSSGIVVMLWKIMRTWSINWGWSNGREEEYIVVELYDMYSSPNIMRVIKSRRMIWAGNLACMGSRREAYRIWVGRSRRRWEDNIEFDL